MRSSRPKALEAIKSQKTINQIAQEEGVLPVQVSAWKRDDLKYYWRKNDVELIPMGDKYLQPSRRIC